MLPAGDRALLVELPGLAGALGMFDALSAAALPGVRELVPAARTVLVHFDPLVVPAESLIEWIRGLELADGVSPEGRTVQIAVRYDGEDLPAVAALLGISEAEVIERHTGSDYRVAFGGFAPGFAYLTGGDPVLDVPRRSSPRTRIPAGAVGLAGTFSGVYPRESPGGWQIIGHTPLPMWNLDHDPPATLQPGDRVRFVYLTDAPVETAPPPVDLVETAQPPVERVETPNARLPALQIINPGALALIQDEGRPGLGAMGVARSGALDVRSLHTANRLVGNPSDATVIEFSFGGAVRALGDVIVALAGELLDLQLTTAAGEVISIIDQRPIALHEADSLSLAPILGARGYLAVRGGLDVPAVLGSRSTDTMAKIGPAALTTGAVLPVASGARLAAVDCPQPWPGRLTSDPVEVPVLVGPRDDWFTPDALEILFAQQWTVTPQSDRVGLRLHGERALQRAVEGELLSEGVVRGALQIPSDGQPVLFLADHPVTGGYPVIAVLHSSALDLAGQLAPGTSVRFVRQAKGGLL